MRIGLLADTHGYLDPALFEHFETCDEIWHAGDIGDTVLLGQLQKFKPLRVVYGNIDDLDLQRNLPEDLWFSCEGLAVWLTHIGGSPNHYPKRVSQLLKKQIPDLFVCGHSHILKVQRDERHKPMLYMNPGAAGNQGFHHMRTVLRFDVIGKEIKQLEVIELGRRGALHL
jgi:uncharacterized protein